MADSTASQQPPAGFTALLDEVETLSDPHVRAVVRDLVGGLLDVHGAGLHRLLELVAEHCGDATGAVLRAAVEDPSVARLLVLHELHPVPRDRRVARAVDEVAQRVGPLAPHIHLERVEGDTAVVAVDGPAATEQGQVGIEAALQHRLAIHAPDVDNVRFVAASGRARLPVVT